MQTKQKLEQDKRYLSLLAREYPNIQSACTEIINLQAILNLPKGTEHFMSDIHGEAEAFLHILNNASGVVREKLDVVFSNTMSANERRALATLIYYPEHALDEARLQEAELRDWYKITLNRLIEVCREVTSKYTRSKVRKALPKDFEYIIDELLNTTYDRKNKEQYYQKIIATIIDIERADEFIIALCNLIKRMAVDHLHIVGDIFDRGPHADVILDKLLSHHSVDIQWGNHDVLWMGAALGSEACIAAVLNNSMKYNNLDIIENAYGINLLPLALMASEQYEHAERFRPANLQPGNYDPRDIDMISRMHKAICIIQFKLEGQLIARRPEFKMQDRDMLSRVNYETKTIEIDGKQHPLADPDLPTVDPAHPNELTPAERQVMDQLVSSFQNSERLQRHIRFLYTAGTLYRKYNDNLLFHGCLPCKPDGSFEEFRFEGRRMKGKEFLDYADEVARRAYNAAEGTKERQFGMDFLWFLWCGRNSPVFGRQQITTFERIFVEDESTWKEQKNAYYKLSEDEAFCDRVLAEFGITSPFSHIINGHIPVRVKEGEGPVKANGKLIVIDGGFCRAYQKYTGIAGYTMFFSSHGIRIAAHKPWDHDHLKEGFQAGADILSTTVIYKNLPNRLMVSGTDTGRELSERIRDLTALLNAYRMGILKENDHR